MFKKVNIPIEHPKDGCDNILKVWSDDKIKVVVASPDKTIKDVKIFYESIFPFLGRPAHLAEDAMIKDRSNQRTGEIWMEIRFDPKIKNAYRHSKNAQPLHTDGSYIPDFPNSSLLCCVTNSVSGGETVFIDADLIVSILKKEDLKTFEYLASNEIIHSRSGDFCKEKVLRKNNGKWLINWNYYCIDNNETKETKKIVQKFFDFLKNNHVINENLLNIKLNPGEAVMWKDNEVLHGRNSFKASSVGDRFIWKCAFDIGNF